MQTTEDLATVQGGNGAAAAGAPKLKRSMGASLTGAAGPISIVGLAGIPVYVLMNWWQAKQGEKQAAELVATPPVPARSPVKEGAAVAMKGSR